MKDVREAAVDVGDFAGDAGRQIGQQEGGGVAHFFDGDVAAQRRVRGGKAQQLAEVLDARGGQGLDRAGRDAVGAHALLPSDFRQVAHAGFQRCLGQAHGVVVGQWRASAPR
jgi:hypothetical protein